MTTATKTESEISLSNFRVTYQAPRYEDGRVLYDGYCAILADDAALDGAEVRVFDVPDVDEGQLAAALFACEAMNAHEQLVTALRQCVSFIRSTDELAKVITEPHVLKLADEALATTTSK